MATFFGKINKIFLKGADMCNGANRVIGSMVCAHMTQDVKDALGYDKYEVGYSCMCVGFWKWANNKGYELPIMGSATHNCAINYVDSPNWTLADLISDLN